MDNDIYTSESDRQYNALMLIEYNIKKRNITLLFNIAFWLTTIFAFFCSIVVTNISGSYISDLYVLIVYINFVIVWFLAKTKWVALMDNNILLIRMNTKINDIEVTLFDYTDNQNKEE